MNDFNSDNKPKKVIQSPYNIDDLIYLLQKMFNDFNMIDCKMKEILNSESIEKEGLQDIAKKLNEANIELNQCAEIRNKKIDELLKMIKN